MKIRHPEYGLTITAIAEGHTWQWYVAVDIQPQKSCWVWLRFGSGEIKMGSWVHNRFNQTVGSHTVEPTHWAHVLEPIYEQ